MSEAHKDLMAPIAELGETSLLPPGTTAHDITEAVSSITETKAPRGWWILFLPSLALLGILHVALVGLFYQGIGVWGNKRPGLLGLGHYEFCLVDRYRTRGHIDFSNFVFVPAKNGALASTALAEAMTVFAVLCAAMFPAVHTGRPWFDYYLFPLPNQMQMWPNFKSPLMWDVFAVNTYLMISVIFWYVGLIPDLATLRDRSKTLLRKRVYGALALGWRGAHRHWQHYERAYLIFAAISTPLVLSVHSVVSFDFATSVIPGWHTTIFPPYFVAGAVFSGFALVMTLMLICRTVFKMHNIVTMKHLDLMNKFMLGTSLLVGYAYAMEFFIAWYSGNPYESWVFYHGRLGGAIVDEHGNWGSVMVGVCADVFLQLCRSTDFLV